MPLSLEAEGELVGIWDEFRIEQVLSNLFSNALRYGAGNPVRVEVAAVPGGAQVTVRDQGIGIPLEDQRRIFQQFERANGANAVAGLGLGLFISEQIARAHGGRIDVSSAPGQGSAFTLFLPLT